MSKHDETKHHRKKGPTGFLLFVRMLISLAVLVILFLASYQAFKSFSGIDPLDLNPQQLAKNALSSEYLVGIASKVLSFDPSTSKDIQQITQNIVPTPPPSPLGTPIFRFAVVADSHNDNIGLEKALNQAKAEGVKFVVGLGDYTDVGTEQELNEAKKRFEASGIAYYSTAGDHDLWDARNRQQAAITTFADIFGPSYTSFGYDNTRIILIDNSDNYLGIDGIQEQWIEQELIKANQSAKVIFVFSHSPFYHPSSDHVYGKVEAKFKQQADQLLNWFKQYQVSEVIAGDTHVWSQYTEPRTSLKMTTIGAVTSSRNTQNPRFAIIDVYDSGQYTIEDIEIK